MRRFLLFLLMMCMFMISAELKKRALHQQRREAKEHLNMLHSAEVALEIPLMGNMSWEDLLEKR